MQRLGREEGMDFVLHHGNHDPLGTVTTRHQGSRPLCLSHVAQCEDCDCQLDPSYMERYTTENMTYKVLHDWYLVLHDWYMTGKVLHDWYMYQS